MLYSFASNLHASTTDQTFDDGDDDDEDAEEMQISEIMGGRKT